MRVRNGLIGLRTWTCSVVLLALSGLPSDAGQQKIVDRAQSAPGSEFIITREFAPAELADLVKESDLIVRALVVEGRSRLSIDERGIETDYQVRILEIYAASQMLNVGRSIVVTRPGGTLMIDGRTILQRETDFPPFENNGEYVLFVKLEPSSGRYVVPFGGQGAFRETGGLSEQVAQFNGKFKGERGSVPTLQFAQEIRELAVKQ